MATYTEELSLSRVFRDKKGVIFDVDGSLADNEGPQEELWRNGVKNCFQVEDGGEVHMHITDCFRTGSFADLVPGIFTKLRKQKKIPAKMGIREFDETILKVRIELMRDGIKSGAIHLVAGAKEALELFRNEGWNRGLYTNSPKELSQLMCELLLGKAAFDLGIPPAGRVFGWEIPEEKKKPDPYGWGLALGRIGTSKRTTIIVEDRPQNILRAVREGFSGAIGICDGKHEKFLDELGHKPDNIFLVPDWTSVVA